MKKLVIITCCLFLNLTSNCQDNYNGFAISGNSNNYIYNTDNYTNLNLNNTLGFHYFINKNNLISFEPQINYRDFGSSNNFTSNISFGLGYKYIYWISSRIGVESSISLVGIGDDELNLDLELSAIAGLAPY